jgi:hypothetical protein
VRTEAASIPDWRDPERYAALLDADRSLFAWVWLRRDPLYVAAAETAFSGRSGDRGAAAFGLVAFEPPGRAVPDARPLWATPVYPYVLAVTRDHAAAAADSFDFDRFRAIATSVANETGEHLLLSDGLFAVRLDGPPGAFSGSPVSLRYMLQGIAAAERPLLTLRRFLSLCRSGCFSSSLHPREARARRWILMLRAADALAAGADQRQIANKLLSRTAGEARWRSREPSVRSQAQRLVRSARRLAAGDYRRLLD